MKRQRKVLLNFFAEIYEAIGDGTLNTKLINSIFNKIIDKYDLIYEIAINISELDDDKVDLTLFNKDINDATLYYHHVKENKDNPNSIVMILSALKNIVYDCLIAMRELVIDSKKVLNGDDNILYHTLTTNNRLRIKGFKVFILFYFIQSIFVDELHIGIDFEFNSKKIALMQINFEGVKQKNKEHVDSIIYIIHPPQFDTDTLDFFTQRILENKKIVRILHGSDSLDIPYLYYDFLGNNKKSIVNFTKKLVDTRYQCEYFNIDNKLENQKCKIYIALKNFGVITEKQYDYLLKNEKEMGPIYDIFIDVNKLSKPLLLYTLYDVIYLKHMYQKFVDIKSKREIYKTIIPEITQLVFLEKRGITGVISDVIKITNSMNNYMIKSYDGKSKDRLIDIFNLILPTVELESIPLNKILSINYFKGNLTMLFKYITYYLLSKKYVVYVNRKDTLRGELSLKEIYSKLYHLKFINIIKAVNEYKQVINKLI